MKMEELLLEDLCSKITDGSHSSPKSIESSFKMASVKDMTRFGINLESCRTISEQDFSELVRNGCMPQKGDVLIAKDGATCLDTVCVVEDTPKYVLLSSVAILRPNEKIRSNFLRYCFETPAIKQDLKDNYVSGSAIPRVVLKDFRRFKIKVPPIGYQDKALKILNSLDEKININNQINVTLESMAKAIFKECFIDFGPVKAKNEGKKPFGLNNKIASLFPSSFEDSELGPIPKGWVVKKLESIAEIKHGFAFKGEYFSDVPTENILLTPGNFKIGGGFKADKFKYYAGPLVEGYVLSEDDLIVTMTDLSKEGDTLGYPALIPRRANLKFLHNQRVGLLTPKDGGFKFWLYNLLQTPAYRSWILGSCTGSTVKHTSPGRILQYNTVIPSAELMTSFQSLVQPLYDSMKLNEAENFYLTDIRELLMPKLIAGEIDLKAV